MFRIENFSKVLLVLAIMTTVLLAGCSKQSGEALVIETEYIPIRRSEADCARRSATVGEIQGRRSRERYLSRGQLHGHRLERRD